MRNFSLALLSALLASCTAESAPESLATSGHCILKAQYVEGTQVSVRTWQYLAETLTRTGQHEMQVARFASSHFYDRGDGRIAVELNSSCDSALRFVRAVFDPTRAPDSEIAQQLSDIEAGWSEINADEYSRGP